MMLGKVDLKISESPCEGHTKQAVARRSDAAKDCGVAPELIASHAVAWRDDKSPEVRLDPYNGLLLAASIDRLFDQGLIAFADDGRLLRKPMLSQADLRHLGLGADARLRRVHARHVPYLTAHRAKHGFDG